MFLIRFITINPIILFIKNNEAFLVHFIKSNIFVSSFYRNICFSYKVCNDITQNTSIIKNVILILYNYSLELNTVKNLYNFLNEFMDNIDNFIFLVLCNFQKCFPFSLNYLN